MPDFITYLRAKNETKPAFQQVVRDANTAAVAVEGAGRRGSAGMNALAASSKMAAMNSRNLVFQLNDVAVSLASGVNPAMVAMQQGPQILQMGIGNVISSVGSLARSWGPVALAIGAVTTLFVGLTHEINKTAETQVSLGDVFIATMQLAGESIYNFLKPAIEQIGTWFSQLWDFLFPIIKDIVNTFIGGMVGAYNAIVAAWSHLPEYFGGLGKRAWNALLEQFEQPALTINGQVIIPGLDLSGMKAQLTDAEQGAMGAVSGAFGSGFSQDYVGDALSAIGDRAQSLALANKELDELDKKAGKAADDGVSKLTSKMSEFGEVLKSSLSGLGSGLWQAIRQGGDVVGNILDMLTKKADDLIGKLLDNSIDKLLFGTASAAGGPLVGGLLSGLLGFENGGSFRVGGAGGPDSQIRAIAVSPDELVSVTRPGQSGPGGKSAIINQHFHLAGAISAGDVLGMAKAAAGAAVQEVKANLGDWQVQQQVNGGIS